MTRAAQAVPRGPAPSLDRLVLDRLTDLMAPRLARTVLRRALEGHRLERVPRDPLVLRAFVEGPLARVARLPLDGFEPVYDAARRAWTEPPSAADRRVLVLSVDPTMLESVRMRVRSDVTVARADSLHGLSPLAEIGQRSRCTLIVDVPLCPVSLPALARMPELFPEGCALWLVGVPDVDRPRVASLFEGLRERLSALVVCERVRELDL